MSYSDKGQHKCLSEDWLLDNLPTGWSYDCVVFTHRQGFLIYAPGQEEPLFIPLSLLVRDRTEKLYTEQELQEALGKARYPYARKIQELEQRNQELLTELLENDRDRQQSKEELAELIKRIQSSPAYERNVSALEAHLEEREEEETVCGCPAPLEYHLSDCTGQRAKSKADYLEELSNDPDYF